MSLVPAKSCATIARRNVVDILHFLSKLRPLVVILILFDGICFMTEHPFLLKRMIGFCSSTQRASIFNLITAAEFTSRVQRFVENIPPTSVNTTIVGPMTSILKRLNRSASMSKQFSLLGKANRFVVPSHRYYPSFNA